MVDDGGGHVTGRDDGVLFWRSHYGNIDNDSGSGRAVTRQQKR